MTSGSVVMSSLQAAKDRIIITGTLTSNVNLIFPAWIKSWVVHNNCTGNFSITCRTASGSGVIVIPGLVSRLFCDGVNISDETYNPNNDMVGMVAGFAMNSAPEGWLVANGSAVSRVTYARLFSRIGTLYGSGDGSTTFNLPDARGVVLRGADLGSGRDTGRVFGSYQPDAVKTIDLKYYGPNGASGSRTVFALQTNSGALFTDSINQSDTSQLPAFQMSGAVENRVKNIAILNCIKY
ncbi:tail fiber protein [Cronobacter sakazakii]|nr:tail fiber protein [Cronobacter sakazakii]